MPYFFIANSFYAHAQTTAYIVQTIEKNYSWARARIIEECITVNGPKEMFTRIMSDNRSFDISTFSYASVHLGQYFDKVYSTNILSSAEKTSVNTTAEQKAACAKEIAKVLGRLHITLDAQNLKMTDNSYELGMTTITTIGDFFNPERGVGVSKGWRPNSDKVSIIINQSNKSGKPAITWSKDFKNCTINLPSAGNTNYLYIIFEGLRKGGKIK